MRGFGDNAALGLEMSNQYANDMHKEHANELLTFLKETSARFPAKLPMSPWSGSLWAERWAARQRKADDV